MPHDVDGVVGDLGVVVVQRDQVAVAFESAVAQPRLAATGKVHADVVEHSVKQHAQAAPVCFSNHVVEISVVAEPRVDVVVVGGVVAVGARSEDRPQCNTRRAQGDRVVEPRGDAPQPVFSWIRWPLLGGKAPTKPSG